MLDLYLKKDIKDISFTENYSYFDFILDILSKISLNFISSPVEGLQCIGFLEARNLRFKNVFLIDANDGVFPPLPDPNSFLSDYIKRSLDIADIRTTNDIYRYYLENIILGAENVFIYHLDTNKTIKSSIVEKIVWEMEKRCFGVTNFSQSIGAISFETFNPKKIEKDDKIKKIIRNISYSYTAFSTYTYCEIMFYYEYVIGVRFEEKNKDYKVDEGIKIHKCINEFLKNFKGKKINFFEKDLVLKFIDKAIKDVFGERNDIETIVISNQIRKRLFDLYEFLIERRGDNILVETEKEASIYMSFDKENAKVVAKADAIFENNKRLYIVDFKMSSDANAYLPRFKNMDDYKKIGSLQLPLYIDVFSNFYSNVYVYNASLIMLGSKKIEERFLYEDNFNIQDEFKKIVLNILIEIYNKKYFEPPQDEKRCKTCPYRNLCF